MKKLVFAAFLALSVFAVQSASAQNYQPFSRNHTYHFSAQDSIYGLKIDSSYVQNGDSVFVFNKIAKTLPKPYAAACSSLVSAEFSIYGNNQFGRQVVKKPNGDFQFVTLNGDLFLLKTKAAIGQNWVFNGTLTATLTAKGFEPILTASDSVITFTISNGDVIKVSKNYGFIRVPNFISYLDNYFTPKNLTIYKLPEPDKKKNIASAYKIFDFQPNDQFGHYSKQIMYGALGNCTIERWIHTKIISRTISADGNTVYYGREIKSLTTILSPPPPFGPCSGPYGSTVSGPGIDTLIITLSYDSLFNLHNNFYRTPKVTNPGASMIGGRVATDIYKKPAFFNREVIKYRDLWFSACNNTFGNDPDNEFYYSYATGLGEVEFFHEGYWSQTLKKMECYIKGAETYGDCQYFSQIIGFAENQPPAPVISIFPNPAENTTTLKFDQPLTSGKVTVTVLNTLGKTMLQLEFSEVPDQQINLNLEKLAKGIYVVQATQNGKTFTSRFVKQ